MKRCPLCQNLFDDSATHCELDGTELDSAAAHSNGNDKDAAPLSNIIALESPIEIQRALRLAISLCDAVEHLHGQGRFVGSLRPRDILISGRDEGGLTIKEIESKVSPAKERALESASVYSAPEIDEQQPADAVSDVYCIGAILYEMIGGQVTFTASSPAAIIIKKTLERPRPLSDLRPGIPDRLEQILNRAIDKERSARQQSPAELKQELEEALSEFRNSPAAALPLAAQPDNSSAGLSPSMPLMAAPSAVAIPAARASGASRKIILAILIGTIVVLGTLAAMTLSLSGSRPDTAAAPEKASPSLAEAKEDSQPNANSSVDKAEGNSNANNSGGNSNNNRSQPKSAAPPRRSRPAARPAESPRPKPEPDRQDNANRNQPSEPRNEPAGADDAKPQKPDASPTPAPEPERIEPKGARPRSRGVERPVRAAPSEAPPSDPDATGDKQPQPESKPTQPPEPSGTVALAPPQPQSEPPAPSPKKRERSQPSQPQNEPSQPDNTNQPPDANANQPVSNQAAPPAEGNVNADGMIQNTEGSPPPDETNLPAIALVSASVLAACALMAYLLLKRRRRLFAGQAAKADSETVGALPPESSPKPSAPGPPLAVSVPALPQTAPPRSPNRATAASPLAQNGRGEEETVRVSAAQGGIAQKAIKRCPSCETEFSPSVRFCVHDGTPLKEEVKDSPSGEAPSFYDLQTLDTKRRCPACSAEYASGKKFCRFDGQKLVTVASGTQAAKPSESMEPFMVAQYRCFARLGEGGMGVVYKARDVELDRLAAVKVLLPQTANLPDASKRFRREAQLASSINHPNSVVIYGYGEASAKLFYMAMEFIPGISLSEIVHPRGQSSRPLPIARVLNITRQICNALDAAHQAGIVHRDLKPQNVMICERPNRPDIVKVVDFGIARSLIHRGEYETLSGTLTGTPAYMSPEQARTEPDIDARSDLFSLAVMVYEMLSGKLPFPGKGLTAWQQIMQRATLQDMPPPLGRSQPELNIPATVDQVLAHALAPDRGRRTRSALQFIEELERAVSAGLSAG